jgi:hypothetical protein
VDAGLFKLKILEDLRRNPPFKDCTSCGEHGAYTLKSSPTIKTVEMRDVTEKKKAKK